jgi:hypothetical protein
MKVLIFYGYIITWLFIVNTHVLEASKKREKEKGEKGFFDFLSETPSNKKRKLEENKNKNINNNENIHKSAINFLLTPSNTPTYIENLLNEKDKTNKEDLTKSEESPAFAMLIELINQANQKLTKISESNSQLGEQLKKLEKKHEQLKIDFKNYKIEVNHIVNKERNQNSYGFEKIKVTPKLTDCIGEDSNETTQND